MAKNQTSFKKGHKDLVPSEARKRAGKKISSKLKGRKITWKDKISKTQIGRKLSIKTKQKMKGRKPWNYIDGRSKNQSWFRYGPDWKNIRKAVLIRDNFTCQHCFKINIKFDIHHKIPFLLTKDNSLDNLITLCDKCHKKEEIRIMKELKKQGDN